MRRITSLVVKHVSLLPTDNCFHVTDSNYAAFHLFRWNNYRRRRRKLSDNSTRTNRNRIIREPFNQTDKQITIKAKEREFQSLSKKN